MKRNRFFALLTLLILVSGYAAAQNPKDPAQRNIEYMSADGTVIEGYLAIPDGSGPFPAVLMIHEWWGLNQDTAELADALSAEGYVVLAGDAFRGSVASTAGDARKQVTETPRDQIAADLDAGLDFLRSHEMVDPNRVAAQGFCFGGTQSMYMGTRNPELAAVVIFYGGGPITEANQLGSMKQAGPVLGIYGEEDSGIPVDQVRSFQRAMNQQGVENTVTIYPGVGHAFVKSDTYNRGGAPEKAWNQMIGFLDENLKP